MSTDPAEPKRSALARVAAIGAAAQASVPGLYAWTVTVAPAAWSRGASWIAKAAAIAGVLSLVVGVVLEQRRIDETDDARRALARHAVVWGLTLTSAVVWLMTPAALAPLRFDAPRGIAGLLGWGLFAFVSAAPALRQHALAEARLLDAPALAPRNAVRRGDVAYIGAAVAVAIALQAIGWRTEVPERALLTRLVTIATGLALIGAATQVSLARHERRTRPRTSQRIRGALVWLVLLLFLAAGGVLLVLR